MPPHQIVLDLETQKTFDEVGGRSNFHLLGVTVVGTYFYETNEYKIFEEKEIPSLENELVRCSRLIGFNIRRFDLPVLAPYLKTDSTKIPILDIMDELEKILGHRVSLESVAQATLGVGKSGKGLDAIAYYRSGEMEKLKKYCLDDVRLTREIYEYGKKNGEVFYQSRDGQHRLPVKIQWKDPEPPQQASLF
ncbi:MAG: ribonuclease H-like domain-containing protein [Deltaproteobacteria bacterium]|nr:ribonuclease H-like domain-containing protein [Deltaproteobacteria bacterium]